MSLNDLRGEVFQLYIASSLTLETVIARIGEKHNIKVSPATLKAKLKEWGYSKNIKRQEVMAILRTQDRRRLLGKRSAVFLNNRPVNARKVEQYRRRNRIRDAGGTSLAASLPHLDQYTVSQTPPISPFQRTLTPPEPHRLHEKVLYDIEIYVKGSFESRTWAFNGNEAIIRSSLDQVSDCGALHHFLGALDTGCTYFASGNSVTGGMYWRRAFREVPTLVRSTYHDILPNLIQKINDLNRHGFREAAIMLKNYVAENSAKFQPHSHAREFILRAFADLEVDGLYDLEALIMTQFAGLFEFYLGTRCYNSFVMRMNLARRQLDRNEMAGLEQYIPALSELERDFGPLDRRSLDVLRLRVETLHRREVHSLAEREAQILSRRAASIENDDWLRLYFHVKGQYYTGMAQYYSQSYAAAAESLSTALLLDAEFRDIDHSGLFDPERDTILDRLSELESSARGAQRPHEWSPERARILRSLVEADSLGLEEEGTIHDSALQTADSEG